LSEDNTVSVAELLEAARKLVGVPFLHQGRTAVGVDCIGFMSATFLQRGVDLAELLGIKDSVSYGRAPTPFLLQATQLVCKRLGEPVPGAALLFQMPKAEHPHHFALYTDKGTIIHAEAARKKQVVEQTFGRPWKTWLHSTWAIPGVKYR
jgi:cell wall-associated NlpC family hydrolase